jgi:hypothetical protein
VTSVINVERSAARASPPPTRGRSVPSARPPYLSSIMQSLGGRSSRRRSSRLSSSRLSSWRWKECAREWLSTGPTIGPSARVDFAGEGRLPERRSSHPRGGRDNLLGAAAINLRLSIARIAPTPSEGVRLHGQSRPSPGSPGLGTSCNVRLFRRSGIVRSAAYFPAFGYIINNGVGMMSGERGGRGRGRGQDSECRP